MMSKYENHESEWREEENRIKWEREQAKLHRWIDPRDPDYIAPPEYITDECPDCAGTGFAGLGTGYSDVCDTCAGAREIIVGIKES